MAVVLGIVGAYRDEEGLSLSVMEAGVISHHKLTRMITDLDSHPRVAGTLSGDGWQLSNRKTSGLVDKAVDDANVRSCDD